jgi:hypothetical protein
VDSSAIAGLDVAFAFHRLSVRWHRISSWQFAFGWEAGILDSEIQIEKVYTQLHPPQVHFRSFFPFSIAEFFLKKLSPPRHFGLTNSFSVR